MRLGGIDAAVQSYLSRLHGITRAHNTPTPTTKLARVGAVHIAIDAGEHAGR